MHNQAWYYTFFRLQDIPGATSLAVESQMDQKEKNTFAGEGYMQRMSKHVAASNRRVKNDAYLRLLHFCILRESY